MPPRDSAPAVREKTLLSVDDGGGIVCSNPEKFPLSMMNRDKEELLQLLSFCVLVCASSFPVHVVSAADDNSSSATSDSMVILLNAGATVLELDEYNRTWTGDDGTKFAESFQNTSIDTPTTSTRASAPAAPYNTGRFFTSNFTYCFPVSSPGRQFVRLYFYLSDYANHPASSAIFSVTTGEFTLLNNFSASRTAKALKNDSVIREYSINASSSYLNLTFAPSQNLSGSYAFVNGIEILPMPDLVSSTSPPLLVGSNTVYSNDTIEALETVYRLNVGGSPVSPVQDSGLFRRWDEDANYISGDDIGEKDTKDDNVTIRYPNNFQRSTAPDDVYGTARSMGPNRQKNLNYNLTWVLPVDPGFYYLTRLHFCEIRYPFTKVGQRVFDIFINDQIAAQAVDVIYLSNVASGGNGGIGVPVFRDYVVTFVGGTTQQEIRLALHPNITKKPEFYDSILNGLEVFKLSNSANGNLAGSNPILPGKHGRLPAIVGGAIGGSALLLLLVFSFTFCYLRMGKKRRKAAGVGKVLSLPSFLRGNPPTPKRSDKSNSFSSDTSPRHSKLCRQFSFAEIEMATNGFEESLLLGIGGFGKVYRGLINDGTINVAIKRGNPKSDQGAIEFQTEIVMLSKLRHRHLVSLIGYCDENNEMILVYDYMAHGTLREHLYNTCKPPLTWKQRLQICIGAARGLHYLHTGAKPTVIHRDVKTTNILLNEKWVAKVSDFGLSKAGPMRGETHVSTQVKGSFGYLDPEYFKRQQLTEKSDVYSFGVVLFEVLCARPPLDSQLPKEQASLAEWALHCQKEGMLDKLIDPHLEDQVAPECLEKFVDIAEKCVWDNGAERPTMGDVLWNLELALQVQANAEEKTTDDGTPSSYFRSDNIDTAATSFNTTAVLAGMEDSFRFNPNDVFLELLNASGR